MAKYKDILIENDEIAADVGGMPIWIEDREVIQQDIIHRLRESGLLFQLVGERSPTAQRLIFKKIRMTVESDHRVIPGTSRIETLRGALHINADTEFGPINLAGE